MKYLDKLTILRGLLALIVFISHLSFAHNITNNSLSFIFWPDGNMVVRVFFLLSGYLMAKRFAANNYQNSLKTTWGFYKVRINRIFPLYYFTAIFFIIFRYSHLLYSSAGVQTIFHILTFTYDFNTAPSFVGLFWSLSVEAQFYLLCPPIFLLISKFPKSKLQTIFTTLITTFLIGIIAYRFSPNTPDFIKTVLSYLPVFLFGIFCHELFSHLPKPKISYKMSNFFFAISTTILYLFISNIYYFYRQYESDTIFLRWIYPSIVALIGGFILYISQLYPSQSSQIYWKNLKTNPAHLLEIFGTLSFGFYLWHGEVIKVSREFIGQNTLSQNIILTTVSFITSLILSILTYYYIEKKVVIFKKS
jgi:peptidoglycan/LPS O-acetylase OafA/YrhL